LWPICGIFITEKYEIRVTTFSVTFFCTIEQVEIMERKKSHQLKAKAKRRERKASSWRVFEVFFLIKSRKSFPSKMLKHSIYTFAG
jgi:hypothetical protein